MNSNTPSSSVGGPGSADLAAPTRNSKRPKYSRFSQQELPACKPILTPKWVIATFLLIGFVFIPIGLVSLIASQDVVEIVNQYETECIPQESRNNKVGFIRSSQDKNCSRTLNVTKNMRQPIYVYYQLDNFYQNHRRYVKSRSDQQLRNPGSEGDINACKPEDRVNNHDNTPIVPCGLIAWSLFNDTFTFSRNNQQLTVNKRGISWRSDREHKFGKHVYPKNFQNGPLVGGGKLDSSKPLSEQEDLIVWMRTAALPTFRKLYGKIEEDLQLGDVIHVSLQNNYNTYSFDGKKKLVLSTSNWLGGKNDFIGIAYLTVGGLCLFLAMVFVLIFLINPRFLFCIDASLRPALFFFTVDHQPSHTPTTRQRPALTCTKEFPAATPPSGSDRSSSAPRDFRRIHGGGDLSGLGVEGVSRRFHLCRVSEVYMKGVKENSQDGRGLLRRAVGGRDDRRRKRKKLGIR